MLASAASMLAQDLNRSVSWGGITLAYPAAYDVADKSIEEEVYCLTLEIPSDDECTMVKIYVLHNDASSALSLENRQRMAKNILLDMEEEPLPNFRAYNMDQMKDTRYGDASANRAFMAETGGWTVNGERIVILHGNKLFYAMILTSELPRLVELRKIIRSIKWQ